MKDEKPPDETRRDTFTRSCSIELASWKSFPVSASSEVIRSLAAASVRAVPTAARDSAALTWDGGG